MAQYHDFKAEPISKHGFEALNEGAGGLGDAIAAHFQKQRDQEDAVKAYILQKELDNKYSLQLEQGKSKLASDQNTADLENAKKMFPEMFGASQVGNPINQQADFNPLKRMQGAVSSAVAGQPNMAPADASQGSATMTESISNPVSADNPMKGYTFNPNRLIDKKSAMFVKDPNNDFQMSIKKDQFNQGRVQKMGDDLDPAKNIKNPYGVAQLSLSRAERVEGLVNQYKDLNLDRRETEELAIALNALLQGSNTSSRSQVESLVPQSARGNLAKMTEWLVNEPQGLNQQKFVSRMLNDVLREKQVLTKQVQKFARAKLAKYSDVRKNDPQKWEEMVKSFNLDPADYDNWKSGGFKNENPADIKSENRGGGNKDYSNLWK